MPRTPRLRYGAVIRIGAVILAILAVLAALRIAGVSPSQFTPKRIREFILGFGIWGPLLFVLLYASRAVVLVIPVGVMSLAGGLAYGKWKGTALILVGATLGACLAFLVSRALGRSFIERFGWLHRGRIKSFDEHSERHGFRLILFLRLIPLFQYDAVNFGSGLSRIRFRDFALGSLIGMAPGGFINALLGSSLENVASLQFAVAVALFVLLALVPLTYKKVRDRRRRSMAEAPTGPGGSETKEP